MAETAKTIGIIGGGQLGLMIVEQAHLLGARTLCLDPAPDAPAFALSDGHIVAAYDDAAALEELCRRSDVVDLRIRKRPGQRADPLEKKYNIPQGSARSTIRRIALREKDNARANGLRTPPVRRRGRRGVAACRLGRDRIPGGAQDPYAGIRRPPGNWC